MGFIGLDRTGPIESFVPPIAFAILFGLSMDYEVFLMSRIREERVHGDNTIDAVKDGVAAVGRVIVAAALIMSSVFFSFLLSPDRVSKEFGLVLGVSILTDALLMRMTLVPALLTVLGERSWAIPGWLEKMLPNITIESPGEPVPSRTAAAQPAAPAPDSAECRSSGSAITMSLDGYMAGPNQSLENPLGEGGKACTSGRSRPRRSARRTGGRRRGGRARRRARGAVEPRTSARRSWGGTCSARSAASGATATGRVGGVTIRRTTSLCSCSRTILASRSPMAAARPSTSSPTASRQRSSGRVEAAGGQDVAIGGGAATVQQYLRAGLVDEFEVHVVPLLLGAGSPALRGPRR